MNAINKMKKHFLRLNVGILSAAIVLAGGAGQGLASDGQKEARDVVITVQPLKPQIYEEDRIRVDFVYKVSKDHGKGTMDVALHNVDTGENLVKTIPADLSFGSHTAWVAWGGEAPWSSSKDSALDFMLLGEGVVEEGVPDGFYIPQVTIKDASGNVLAEQKHSSEELRYLRITGEKGITHKVSKASMQKKGEQIKAWLAEMRALAEKAKAAGADTSLPGLMITALDQTVMDLPAYLGGLRYNVVSQNYDYSDKQVPKTRAQLEKLVEDPASGESIDIFPRPKERLTFKNGYFYAGDKPVQMMGMCMFALWPELDRIREMNLNLVHIGVNPLCLFPDSNSTEAMKSAVKAREDLAALEASANSALGVGDVDVAQLARIIGGNEDKAKARAELREKTVKITSNLRVEDIEFPEPTGKLLVADYNDPELTVRRFLDKCLELGIKVDLGLNMHPMPEWFFDEYPDARLQGFTNSGFIPFDIEHPAAIAFTKRFLEIAMKEVAGHPALNSIWLANEPVMLNVGPLSESVFREEMRAKYATIEALNKAWGSEFVDFEAITLPLRPSAGEGNTEFWFFNVGRLTKYFQFMQDCVHQYDPDVNTCFKMLNSQMGWYVPPGNIDIEAVNDSSDIIGMDSGTMPFAKTYYDWLRSLSPEKPMVNLEFKGTGFLTMWRAAFWGMAGIDLWCWHGDSKFAPARAFTFAVHEVPVAMYGIQRNIDIVMAYQQFPRSPFVVLYPDPVRPRAGEYFATHNLVTATITHMGYATDYATEKRVANGRLDEYKYDFIVLPSANYIKDETFDTVGKFVERGGKAIVIGDLPELGQMRQKRDLGWLKAPDGAEQGVTGSTNSVKFAHGKGYVWILPAGELADVKSWIGEIAEKELPPRPVVVSDAFEYRTIPWKTDNGEDCFVTYIMCNYYQRWTVEGNDEPTHAVFHYPVKEAVDLITGEKLDPFNITVPRGNLRLIQWIPEK